MRSPSSLTRSAAVMAQEVTDVLGAIVVRGVVKAFGSGDVWTPALKGIDFSAAEGELHLVVGPSGCGKTTLLSVVAGTLDWDQGEVSVFGAAFNEMPRGKVTAFRRQNIGFIFQQFNLIPTLTLIENVSVPLLLNGMGRQAAESKALEWLVKVGLEGSGLKRPSQLSGGQQQRGTYTATDWLMMPSPPSLGPMTTVLSWANGLATTFSHPPQSFTPEPFWERLNFPRM